MDASKQLDGLTNYWSREGVLRGPEETCGRSHDRTGETSMVSSSVPRFDNGQAQVRLPVGHGRDRRIPVVQVAVIATMEIADALAAALLPPGSTQRDAF